VLGIQFQEALAAQWELAVSFRVDKEAQHVRNRQSLAAGAVAFTSPHMRQYKGPIWSSCRASSF